MNRADFQQLAEDRLLDAQVLFASGRWSGAYYLAGYAVECGLKACIAKLTNEFDFPDKKAKDYYTHNIQSLIAHAKLETALAPDIAANPRLRLNMATVKDWTEESRYEQQLQSAAQEMIDAVADPNDGVLTWIKARW